jgi:hypothetical protein
MRLYTNFGLRMQPAFFWNKVELSHAVSRRTSLQLQLKTEDASIVDKVLPDDASVDDDIMNEKIIHEDFVDDAKVERIMAVIEQCSLWADRWVAKCHRKKDKLNDLLFREGVIMEKDHLARKEEWRRMAEE